VAAAGGEDGFLAHGRGKVGHVPSRADEGADDAGVVVHELVALDEQDAVPRGQVGSEAVDDRVAGDGGWG
jgi:hypothetical protein